MASVFVDRESAYPNRYRVIPESGEAYYVVLERADEAVTPGTPLNAETFNNMRGEIDAEIAGITPAKIGAHPNTWLPTLAQVGAAPASLIYKHISTAGDADELAQIDAIVAERGNKYGIQNAFFLKVNRTVSEGATGGLGGGDYIYTVKTIASNYVWIMAERPVANGLRAYRWKIDGLWTDNWEWDNPLMTVGREYRTTERWNEKVVYTMLCNFGALPNAAFKAVDVDVYPTRILSVTPAYEDSSGWSFSNSMSVKYISAAEYGGKMQIQIETVADLSHVNGVCTVKYTKD